MMRVFKGVPIVATVLLLMSLCLNVALGTYIGAQWLDRWQMPLVVAGPSRLTELIARRLPAADAEILWRVYRGKEAELKIAQSEYREALFAAGAVLAAPQLDVQATRAAVAKARAERIEVGDISIEVFLEALPQMSPEGRKQLLGRLGRP
jgi:uncharacterized membrane protein